MIYTKIMEKDINPLDLFSRRTRFTRKDPIYSTIKFSPGARWIEGKENFNNVIK